MNQISFKSGRCATAFRRAMILGTIAFAASLATPVLAGGRSGPELSALPIPIPSIVQQSKLVGPLNSSQVLNFSVSMPVPKLAQLQAFVDDVSNPASLHYRRFITPDLVGQQFGLPSAQVNQVVAFLKANGLNVTLVTKNHMDILGTGTVGNLQAAFHTTINKYHSLNPEVYGNPDYYAYSKPLQVPKSLAPLIINVGGLQSFTRPKPQTTLTPSMSRTLYNLEPLYNAGFLGQGRTIAIDNFDGYRLSNLPLFYNAYGLPAPPGGVGSNVRIIKIGTGAGSGEPGGEGDLDIQMVLSNAPLCNLVIYDDNVYDLTAHFAQEAEDNIADVTTMSYLWGFGVTDEISAHDEQLSMNAEGMTCMESSGDHGTSLNESDWYPDNDPERLSVGGTVATTDSAGNRISEVAWGPGGEDGGGGGGWWVDSAPFNVLPSWQVGNGVPTNINFRLFPDVAGQSFAPGDAAYYIYFDGELIEIAGTSAACPTWAGSLGVAEQKLISLGGLIPDQKGHQRFGRINDLLYSQNGRSDVWFDVTSGSNGTLPNGNASNAGIGWDTATGWGAVNWVGFVNSIPITPPVTVTPTAVSIYSGQGSGLTGGVSALAQDDSSYVSLGSIHTSAGAAAAIQVSFTTTVPASQIASANLNVIANAPVGTTNFLYLFNFKTNQYDLLNVSAMTGVDKSIAIVLTGIANYVSPSNEVLMVNRAVGPPHLGSKPFTSKLNLATLTEYVIPSS